MDKPTRREYNEQFEYLYNERLGMLLYDNITDKSTHMLKMEATEEAKQLIKEYYPDE